MKLRVETLNSLVNKLILFSINALFLDIKHSNSKTACLINIISQNYLGWLFFLWQITIFVIIIMFKKKEKNEKKKEKNEKKWKRKREKKKKRLMSY